MCSCHDLTVPYPTATFSLHDPFEAFDATGMQVDVDEHNIVRSWQYDTGTKDVRVTVSEQPTKTRPFFPPILYLRWPFTYVSQGGALLESKLIISCCSRCSPSFYLCGSVLCKSTLALQIIADQQDLLDDSAHAAITLETPKTFIQ